MRAAVLFRVRGCACFHSLIWSILHTTQVDTRICHTTAVKLSKPREAERSIVVWVSCTLNIEHCAQCMSFTLANMHFMTLQMKGSQTAITDDPEMTIVTDLS